MPNKNYKELNTAAKATASKARKEWQAWRDENVWTDIGLQFTEPYGTAAAAQDVSLVKEDPSSKWYDYILPSMGMLPLVPGVAGLRKLGKTTKWKSGESVTDIPNFDEVLNKPHMADYFQGYKNKQVDIMTMSPAEYQERAAELLRYMYGDYELDMKALKETRARKAQGYAVDMASQKSEWNIPTLDYTGIAGQEGFHRSMAAGAVGEEDIPVAVMRSHDWDKAMKKATEHPSEYDIKYLKNLYEMEYPELYSEAEKKIRKFSNYAD